LLLPKITDRVVTVSSLMHWIGQISLRDLNWKSRPYSAWLAYGQSKLANLVFTSELQRRLTASGSAVRALAAHPAVRSDAVGVVGHSEGAVHAMGLAARHQEVRAVVLLAGYARLGEDALRRQARSIAAVMPAPVRLLRRPLGALGNRALARIKRSRADTRVAGLPVNARWMREMLAHDSRDDLRAVQAPVLAVTGD
nr:acyl-CoA thioester hydrolase/BAAT C-terminal domain-containing protein [Streptomyces sp. DSM 41633]